MSPGGYTGGEPQRFAVGEAGPEYFVPLNTERSRSILEEVERKATDTTCHVPPPGWWCTRTSGHDGPCAAHPWPDDPRLT
jgi:hypothetical protein